MKILKPIPEIITIDGIEYRMDMITFPFDLMDLPFVDKSGEVHWYESILGQHLKKEGYIEL